MPMQQMLLGGGTSPVVEGQKSYTYPGSYNWTVPAGVTSVSVVCIGGGACGPTSPLAEGGAGGALAYGNNISVTPGSTIAVVVGAGAQMNSYRNSVTVAGASTFNGASVLSAGGGTGGGIGGTSSGSARDGGGDGGNANFGYASGWGYYYGNGGAGAGGYNGDGGDGGSSSSTTGSAGSSDAGGGGAASGDSDYTGGAGGGSSVYGTSGNEPENNNAKTTGGSGGTQNSSGKGRAGRCGQGNWNHNSADTGVSIAGRPQTYLGGEPPTNPGYYYFGAGGGADSNSSGTTNVREGGRGAVRIIWPGDTRSFPSTNVDGDYQNDSA